MMRKLKFKRICGKLLLDYKQSIDLLNEAISKFGDSFEIEFTGEEMVDEDYEIVGKEIVVKLCNDVIDIEVVGWIEVDREEFNEGRINMYFSGIIVIPEFDNIKIGAEYSNINKIIRADYDYENGIWSEFYIDTC